MKQAESFDELYRQIRLRKVPFFVAFAVIVTISYGLLYAIDFIPEPVSQDTIVEPVADDTVATVTPAEPLTTTTTAVDSVVTDPFPRKVIIDALDREVTVANPQSRDVAVLDDALLKGVVRHPDSADFAEDGNVFILGHSSYLPTVFNKNFQAFNGIQNLVWGDTIRVQSKDTEYTYRVQEVYLAKASDAFVPNTPGEARLTLATCNSFGTKDDRFIVEAVLIDTKKL